MYSSFTLLFIASTLALILPSSEAYAGFSFTPDLVTSRIDMFDNDQTACQTYYGGFVLGGPKHLAIGVGNDIFKFATACGQCLQLEYRGKKSIGMVADWHDTLTPKQLDVSPLIASQLGFTGINPDPKEIKASYVSCGGVPSLNLGGKLRYYFSPGSKDSSLEMVILGGFHPIASVVAKINGVTYKGLREAGKFKFIGFVLKKTSVITFTVTFDNGQTIVDEFPIAGIASGLGGGDKFFKSGLVARTDKVGNNKVNPVVLTWKDFIDGKAVLKG